MRRHAGRRPFEHVVQPNNQLRGCSGKRCYESFVIANRMAERTRKQFESHVAPYKCRHCHLWHVGENTDIRKRPKFQGTKASE